MSFRNRWIVGITAAVLVGLLFYVFLIDRPRLQVLPPPSSPMAAAHLLSMAYDTGLSPKAAAQASTVPNFVDLVQAVKPAVVSVRVKSDVTAQVTSSDGGPNPFEGT